jgi:aspartate aminotransferase-like enzyme
MMRDVGSRDEDFIKSVKFIRSKLLEIAGVSSKEYTAIPLQGSGTYSVESVITTATPRDGGKLLIIVNGSYGKRMVKICEVAGIETVRIYQKL